MFKGKQKVIIGMIILLFLNSILFYSKVNVIATDVKVSTLYSIASEKPTVDGVINTAEWEEAIPLTVTLYDTLDQSSTIDITVYSLYDDNSTVYLGVVIPLDGQILDSLIILFKTGAQKIAHFDVLEIGDGHDLKNFDPDNNDTDDCFTDDGSMLEDRFYGGTDEGTGRCTNDTTNIYIEMAFPFDSGDSIGCDLAIDIGESEECFFYAYRGPNIYSQIRIDDEEAGYTELVIKNLEAPVLEEISPSIDPDGNISLEWNNITKADSYNIYRDTSYITNISELTPIANIVDTSYIDSNLANNDTYFYAITAVNHYSESNPSNIQFVTVYIPTVRSSLPIIITLVNLIGVCTCVFIIQKKRK